MKAFSLFYFLLFSVGIAYAQEWTAVYAYAKDSPNNVPLFKGEDALMEQLKQLIKQDKLTVYEWTSGSAPSEVVPAAVAKARLRIPGTEVTDEHAETGYFFSAQLGLAAAFTATKSGMTPLPYFHVFIPGHNMPDGIARHVGTILYADVEKLLAATDPWVYPQNHAAEVKWHLALKKRYLRPYSMTVYKNGKSAMVLTRNGEGIDRSGSEEIPQEIAQHLGLEAETPPSSRKPRFRFNVEVEYDLAHLANQTLNNGALAEAIIRGVRAGKLQAYKSASYYSAHPKPIGESMKLAEFEEQMRVQQAVQDSTQVPVQESVPANVFSWYASYNSMEGKTPTVNYYALTIPSSYSPMGLTKVVAYFNPNALLAYLRASDKAPMASFLQKQKPEGWLNFFATDVHENKYEVSRESFAQSAPVFTDHVEAATLPKYLIAPLRSIYEKLK